MKAIKTIRIYIVSHIHLNSHVQNIEVATNENGNVIHITDECQPEMKKKKNYLKADIYFTRGGKKLAIIAHTKQIVSIRPLQCWSVKSKSKIWQFFIC